MRDPTMTIVTRIKMEATALVDGSPARLQSVSALYGKMFLSCCGVRKGKGEGELAVSRSKSRSGNWQ